MKLVMYTFLLLFLSLPSCEEYRNKSVKEYNWSHGVEVGDDFYEGEFIRLRKVKESSEYAVYKYDVGSGVGTDYFYTVKDGKIVAIWSDPTL